jgi:hypothetical protein
MNKLSMFLIAFGVLCIAGSASATVGGPTFIHTFKYNPLDESVYYIRNSENGRGCPPELMKLSLNSGKSQVVYSCDQGEKLRGDNYDYNGISPVNTEINKIIQNFKDLTPINLKDNRIFIDVNFVNYEKMTGEDDWIKNANFTASVYQDNKKIIDLPIIGCNVEQPFVFAGYAIPGFDKKIVLLLSTKGDCFEGGYIYETLHVVGGVSNLDKTYLNFYKGPSALVPNEGTLVVFESESVAVPIEEENETPVPVETSNNGTLYAILAIALGLGAGYFFGRKTKV